MSPGWTVAEMITWLKTKPQDATCAIMTEHEVNGEVIQFEAWVTDMARAKERGNDHIVIIGQEILKP